MSKEKEIKVKQGQKTEIIIVNDNRLLLSNIQRVFNNFKYLAYYRDSQKVIIFPNDNNVYKLDPKIDEYECISWNVGEVAIQNLDQDDTRIINLKKGNLNLKVQISENKIPVTDIYELFGELKYKLKYKLNNEEIILLADKNKEFKLNPIVSDYECVEKRETGAQSDNVWKRFKRCFFKCCEKLNIIMLKLAGLIALFTIISFIIQWTFDFLKWYKPGNDPKIKDIFSLLNKTLNK